MPHRNSTKREQPTSALRRSPRLLRYFQNQTEPEDQKTPNPKSRIKRVPISDPLPPISTQKVYSKKTRTNLYPNEVSNKFKKSNVGSKISLKSNTGSASLKNRVGGFSCLRRSPRFTGEGNSNNVKFNQESSSDVAQSEVGVNFQRQFVGKIDKRVTRSSNRRNTCERVAKTVNEEFHGTIGHVWTKFLGKKASHRVERAKEDIINSSEQLQVKGKLEKRTRCSSVDIERERERKERGIDEQRKVIGVKRKRNQVDKGHGIVEGWTKDQELALQRAFLVAKPTPHFWKKVAKLVPGKSAQDCFEKVHSDHLTPPQPRPRSRANRTNLPSLSFSPGKLLMSVEPMIKRYNCNKRRTHLTQKTARQLQQKQYHLDQDYEADLFSVLEPNFNQSTQALLSTPENGKENVGFLKRCRERSSSACKKSLSRLGGQCGVTLVSPPVLKPVKNKALHERYIDQLHRREAKRKAAFGRETKSILANEGKQEIQKIKEIDGIKAAKNALVFYAKDVINQIQDLNANAKSNLSDVDDDFDDDDDDGEDEL